MLHEIHVEGMTLSETYQVAATIEKLPPSWVEFKNYLKHKRKKMSVEDLVVRLRIEEDNKLAQKNTYTPDSAKVNMVEHAESSSKSNSKEKGKGKGKNDKKGKGKVAYLAPKAGIVKKKFQGTCYNYDQPGHRAANFKMPKLVNPHQANMVNDNMDMIVIAVDNGEKLYMGNSATVDIKGKRDVILKMTFEKELKLTNVLYVSKIHKNLVSVWLLNKFGFRLVFEYDKFVLSKNQMYVGKGYAINGMFKLNVRKYCYVYLLKSKDEAIEKFVLYKTEVENQLGRKIKVVRSDIRGEYVSLFTEVCAKHGIRHEFTSPYSPQQNGIAERKNRTLKEMVNAMLISSSLCQDMLGEAILTTTYLLNKIPRKDKEETSYELWMGRKPSYQNEPTSYREAINSFEGPRWKEAIKSEIVSILQNHTWELVDLPPDCKPLGYKWIFKKNMKADDNIDKYKARLDTKSGYVILCLYVDDMIIVGSNEKMIKSTKDMLKSNFDMKDMGLADVILRIKIIRTQNGLMLSQEHYVDKILNTHNAEDSGLARTPIDTNLHLSKIKDADVAQLEYSRVIGMHPIVVARRTWWCEGGCGEEVVEAAVGCDDVGGGGRDDGGGWRWGSLGGDLDEYGEDDVGGGWCCCIGGGLVLEGRLVVGG
nr:hypothetical protein [Tanacetum cinerariifolium]